MLYMHIHINYIHYIHIYYISYILNILDILIIDVICIYKLYILYYKYTPAYIFTNYTLYRSIYINYHTIHYVCYNYI